MEISSAAESNIIDSPPLRSGPASDVEPAKLGSAQRKTN
jgi:hypothetical protein